MGELTASAMVDEAKSRIENLTPEEVAKEIGGGPKAPFLADQAGSPDDAQPTPHRTSATTGPPHSNSAWLIDN